MRVGSGFVPYPGLRTIAEPALGLSTLDLEVVLAKVFITVVDWLLQQLL